MGYSVDCPRTTPRHPSTRQQQPKTTPATMVKFELKPFATLTGTGKDDISAGVSARFDHNDLSLQVRADDSGFKGGNLRNGLHLSARKDGHFTFAYNMGGDAPSFSFLTNAKFGDKDVAMKYKHSIKGKDNSLQGKVEIDDKNTATIGWNLAGFDKPDYKQFNLRWNYRHDDNWSVEPSYDFGTEAFAAKINHHMDDDNQVSATYSASDNTGTLEWTNHTMGGPGALKVSATTSLSEEGMKQMPTVHVSKVFDMD